MTAPVQSSGTNKPSQKPVTPPKAPAQQKANAAGLNGTIKGANTDAERAKPWKPLVSIWGPKYECSGEEEAYAKAYSATVNIAQVERQNPSVTVDEIKEAAIKMLEENGWKLREEPKSDGKTITFQLQKPLQFKNICVY